MTAYLQIEPLGLVDYLEAWELQKELAALREHNPQQADRLLLLEHPHTYTLGRHGDENNLVFDAAQRSEKGIALHRVDRGGDVTYHGPGQLVGYPILSLTDLYGRGVGRIRSYVSDIETMLIDTLTAFDIPARRFEGFRGVWVEEEGQLNKIAAIGVYVNRAGITSHGFALNIATNLDYFAGIVPCGIDDHGVTSMNRYLGAALSLDDVIPTLTRNFCRVFDYAPLPLTV